MSKQVDVGAVARRLMNESGGALTYEAAFAKAHADVQRDALALRARVIAAVKANPAILTRIATMSDAPRPFDIGAALEKERVRLMREGRTLDEAVIEASDTIRERAEAWRAETLRLATANGATIVPTVTAAPRPAARAADERFVPLGMSSIEAASAAASGRLPVRTEVATRARSHARLMRLVEERQAKGESYDEAFIAASAEIAAADRDASNTGGK